MAAFDLVVRGGTVVDGTGAAPFDADVAIKDGKIAAIGKLAGSGAEEIDAKGRIVTPGFVDIHTHYDAQSTWDHRLSPSTDHGVTSIVMGNCGVGFAPCRPDYRDTLIKVMEGVEDIPDIVMKEGIPWNWESFPEYLDALAKRSYDADVATQVPHAPVRVYVMGKRGVDREPATAKDMAQMTAIVQQGMEAGALGFTTSRILLHRLKDGSLAPTITAAEEELRMIALGLKSIGKGVLQMVDNFNDVSTEFAMWRRIVQKSGRSLSFNLAQNGNTTTEAWREILGLVADANRDGLDIKAQVCNRPIGVLFGLDCSVHPFFASPSFRAMAHLPIAEKVAAMRDPAMRARLLAETPSDPNERLVTWIRDFDRMFPLGDPPNYAPSADSTLGAEARRRGIAPLDLAYDALLERNGAALLFYPVANYADNNLDAVLDMMKHPNTVQGIADGGAHVGMICDASSPTHLLTYWTRDRKDGEKMSLSWAVKSLTQEPAAALGLGDRGLVAAGYKGDLNIIDYDGLRLHAPLPIYDLPGGGRRLTQKADGYTATVLNGIVTYREGQPTGALPGRLVRGTQRAPRAA